MAILSVAKTFSILVVICITLESNCADNYDVGINNLKIENSLKPSSPYGLIHGASTCGGKGVFVLSRLEGCQSDKPCKLVANGEPMNVELAFSPLIDVQDVGIRAFYNRPGTEPELGSDNVLAGIGTKAKQVYTISGKAHIGPKHKGQQLTARYEIYDVATKTIIACGSVSIELI